MKYLVLAAAAVVLLASSARADFPDGDWNTSVDSASSASTATAANGIVQLNAVSNYMWNSGASAWTGTDGTSAISVYSISDALAVESTTAGLADLHFHAQVSYAGANPGSSTLAPEWPIAFVQVGCMNADQTDFVTQDYTILASGDYDIPVAAGPVTVEFQSYSQLPADQWTLQSGGYQEGGNYLRDVTADLAVSDVSFTATGTPEPATVVLLCAGAVGLLRRRT
jgi:hypothetical protein